jgi:hypothetical protein
MRRRVSEVATNELPKRGRAIKRRRRKGIYETPEGNQEKREKIEGVAKAGRIVRARSKLCHVRHARNPNRASMLVGGA